MAIVVGIAGAARNAAAALSWRGRMVAACEQERLSRTRRAGLQLGHLPAEATSTVLRVAGLALRDVSSFAVAEPAIQLPPDLPITRIDHHRAHAATAFFTSAFDDAIVLVCDCHSAPELTVWRGDGATLARLDAPWMGPAFASLYARATAAMGFAADVDEHRFEALARSADGPVEVPASLVTYQGDHLDVAPGFDAFIASRRVVDQSRQDVARAARVASGVQELIGECLLAHVRELARQFGGQKLCLGGGLFFNSYFNTVLSRSGLYNHVFVPVNPGNAGLAVGSALDVAYQHGDIRQVSPVSPFLGPAYDPAAIKATLDNCKLSYDYANDGALVERTARALAQGKLVGWFQDRMEWGPRALGNRSILASPVAPFVLENINVFLKQREPYRTYGVSMCDEDVARFLRGPASSSVMEYDYEVIAGDTLGPMLPLNASRLRVQTVAPEARQFHALIKAFGDLTGVPMLVNTSFNGFNEPIVCTPRDAIRVFFGTGLDVAILGDFVLTK